jgi:hypothetical protein
MIILIIYSKQSSGTPSPKEQDEGEAEKPESAEQGNRQRQLHHPHAKHHEDMSRECHEEPQKDDA